MTHDYKAVLKAVDDDLQYFDDKPDDESIDYEYGNLCLTIGDLKAIRHALLGMHRLMQEPSEGMVRTGEKLDEALPDSFAMCSELFKAMRSAMLAEIDGGVV
jgi:hypothetical protein